MIAGAVLMLWKNSEKPGKIPAFENLEASAGNQYAANNIVNELLLSANDLHIYGKSAFIDYSRNNNTETAQFLEQVKTNPGNAYQTMLKNKIHKLKQKQAPAPDFSVRPVPK